MQRVASLSAMIFYAAPHDVNENLGYLYERLGDRRVAVIKEISKIHEKVTFFNLSEARVEEPRGEYVLVTDGANEENALNGLSVEEHVSFYADKGMSKMEAIKQTAKDRGTSKNEIYKLFSTKTKTIETQTATRFDKERHGRKTVFSVLKIKACCTCKNTGALI